MDSVKFFNQPCIIINHGYTPKIKKKKKSGNFNYFLFPTSGDIGNPPKSLHFLKVFLFF
jgi:hypothetical protein